MILGNNERQLYDQARMFGIRAVLQTLVNAIDHCAEQSVGNVNTVQAKQWAAWACAIEALRDDRKLIDPGRE